MLTGKASSGNISTSSIPLTSSTSRQLLGSQRRDKQSPPTRLDANLQSGGDLGARLSRDFGCFSGLVP